MTENQALQKIREAADILSRDFPSHIKKHYPRMKRAFKRGGFPAVNEYMAKVTGRRAKA